MSYQVLARKWRPKAFDQLVGQDHVVRALSNALDQQRLHHAYLFTGTRGVGKTTLSRILAKALNCETGISSKPCGVCTACVEIDGGRFIDYVEMDAASNRGVDDMTSLLEKAIYAPTQGRFKIYMMDEVHQLTGHAFNAMLKTLEEPPAHVKFILATTDPQKVPVTILSRCLQFNLRQMSPTAISEYLQVVLQQENIAFEANALQLLARAAAGSMRDALSLLDQAIAFGSNAVHEAEVRSMLGAIDQSYLFKLLHALVDGNGPSMMAQADAMEQRGLSFDAALSELAALLHQIAIVQTVPDSIPADLPERAMLLDLAARLSAEDLQLYYQIALLGRRDLGLAPDEYAGFTMCLLRMLAFRPDSLGNKPSALARSGAAPTPAKSPVAALQQVEEKVSQSDIPKTLLPAISAETPTVANKEFDGDWRSLVEQLKLGGLARMLAQNCELTQFDGQVMHLCVAQTQKHLLENSYQEKLRIALKAHFGKHLQLYFDIGSIANTPAGQISQEKATRQSRAESAIQNDSFVRELVDSFDAQIIPSSIKPIQ